MTDCALCPLATHPSCNRNPNRFEWAFKEEDVLREVRLVRMRDTTRAAASLPACSLQNSRNAMKLKELAAELGLSQTTVSRALNGYPEVNEATRQRVSEAARRLGYSANVSARRLATGRSGAIGVALPPLVRQVPAAQPPPQPAPPPVRRGRPRRGATRPRLSRITTSDQ